MTSPSARQKEGEERHGWLVSRNANQVKIQLVGREIPDLIVRERAGKVCVQWCKKEIDREHTRGRGLGFGV